MDKLNNKKQKLRLKIEK